MPDAPPAPPANAPDDVVDALDDLDRDSLRQFARYAEALADRRERPASGDDERSDDEATGQAADRPADVPGKATVTTKEINDNRYDYWQWRDGDRIRSKYKGPVDPDD